MNTTLTTTPRDLFCPHCNLGRTDVPATAPDAPDAREARSEMDHLVVRNGFLIDIFAKRVRVDWSFPTRHDHGHAG